jgi:hypothetical protein
VGHDVGRGNEENIKLLFDPLLPPFFLMSRTSSKPDVITPFPIPEQHQQANLSKKRKQRVSKIPLSSTAGADGAAAAAAAAAAAKKTAQKKVSMMSQLNKERQRDEKRVQKFRQELTNDTNNVNREITGQFVNLLRELKTDDADFARQQAQLKRIVNLHQTLASSLDSRARRLNEAAKEKGDAAECEITSMMKDLTTQMSNLQNDMAVGLSQRRKKALYFQKHTEELIKMQQSTLKLRENTFQQLDEIIRSRITTSAAQPWTLQGYNGVFATSKAADPLLPPDRLTNMKSVVACVFEKKKSGGGAEYDDNGDDNLREENGQTVQPISTTVPVDNNDDDQIPMLMDDDDDNNNNNNNNEDQQIGGDGDDDTELRRRERTNSEPPPSGFATDSSSQIIFLLCRLQNKLNRAQRTDAALVPSMKVNPET